MKNKILILFLVLTLPIFSQETKQNLLLEKAINYLGINSSDVFTKYIEIKKYGNNKTIILLPEINKNDSECEECFSINNNILIWNNNSEKFEFKYVKKNEWYSDAFYLSTLKLDTGNYNLKDNLRAFGIRYSFSGSSRVDPAGRTYLKLYIPKKNTLKEVLNEFTVNSYNGESNGGCETLQMKTEKSILIISENSTNDFKDIIVKTNYKEFHYDNECDKEIITKEYKKSKVLKFLDGKYTIE